MGRGASAFCLFTFRIFKKIFYFARTHTKKLSPLLLLIWNSLQHPAVSYVWYSFDPQHISCLTSVPLHFLLNSESIITTPGRIFFYMYTESMLLTRVFQCTRVKKGTGCWSFSPPFQELQGWHCPTLCHTLGWRSVSSWVCISEGKAVKDTDLPEADD